MKRNKHSLSHYKLSTFDMGELVPVGCYEVLPGDTIQQSTSALLRVSPLLAPVMHPVSVRIHHWFVPNRLIWDDWEKFITGGPDGLDASEHPYIDLTGFTVSSGVLLDYLGINAVSYPVATHRISALPLRAYQMIFNEFYRDQDLTTASVIDTTSGNDVTTDQNLKKVCWEKDYFTSSRPWPQKGADITLPLGTSAPVYGDGESLGLTDGVAPFFGLGSVAGSIFGNTNAYNVAPGTAIVGGAAPADSVALGVVGAGNSSGLYADLSAATSVNVNDVRRAFALQRYQEARAQFGSRYTEYLRYLGVRSSDARLQRPEYLGGGKQTIAFSEVLQTGPDGADEGVANLKGHGISAMRSRRYRKFFEEHGLVISLMSVRPRTMYTQGIERMWKRTTKEDYWQKELELIGQQEVLKTEAYSLSTPVDEVFGYQDRYAEYRHIQSQVNADFRDLLDYWHLGRIFGAEPTLNSTFVTCDPSKRINAVQTEDVLWCMINHSIQARRMVTRKTIGRIF